MTVFHSALDALMQAGGIEKSGSLRQIKLIRDGRSTIIDLYALLMHGSGGPDLRLRDGDRIVVPPLGPTVAVAGAVKRPAIYEILPEIRGMHHLSGGRSQSLSLNEMLELGGGVLIPAQNRFLNLSVTSTGLETVKDVTEPFKPLFSDGSILMVSKGDEKRSGTIELVGHTRRPGLHALDSTPTLSSLFNHSQILGPDIYPMIGVIERTDPERLTRQFYEFSPQLVLAGQFDRKLQDGDVLYLFSNAQIDSLEQDQNNILRNVLYGSADPQHEQDEEEMITDPIIRSFLTERAVSLRGAVRKPGPYPVAEGATLDHLLSIAGGMTLEANAQNVEITSNLFGQNLQSGGRSGTERKAIDLRDSHPKTITLAPGDTVRVNQKFRKVEDQSVLIIGEVTHPGRYDLLPGDTVLDLMRRAGGLTDQAYPDGAIFSRASERRAEAARFRATARELQSSINAAQNQDDEKHRPTPQQISMAQSLASELMETPTVGRITVETDPAVLSVKPELDMLLEADDRIFIPKRPLTVRVSGEVLSPANLQFRSGQNPRDYIQQAGGYTFHADKSRTFVLYPDGSAQPLQLNHWEHTPVMIPPGSTIVVPRDPEPFSFMTTAKDISQILVNLATTAIFVSEVRNND